MKQEVKVDLSITLEVDTDISQQEIENYIIEQFGFKHPHEGIEFVEGSICKMTEESELYDND